jgi:hypothetical protein
MDITKNEQNQIIKYIRDPGGHVQPYRNNNFQGMVISLFFHKHGDHVTLNPRLSNYLLL